MVKKTVRVYKHNSKKKKAIKQLKKSFFTEDGEKKETSIEKLTRLILSDMGLFFKQEFFVEHKPGKWKCYDFLVTNGESGYTFLIEVDGEYFHAGIHKAKDKEDLNYIQRKNLRNDKFKNKLAKDLGLPLLRLKESDIKCNPNLIRQTILEEIKAQTKN